MRSFFILMLLTAAGISAQNAARTPEFEAAVIRQAGNEPRRMQIQNDRLDFANISLKEMVAQAFHVELYQVRTPHWMETQHYSITAKLPAGTTKDQIPPMLKALLVDRLKLKVHRESMEQPVYALLVASGGPKLKKPEDKPAATPASGQGPRPGMVVMRMTDSSTIHVTMLQAAPRDLARFLTDKVHRPVLDETGLSGEFDIEFDGKIAVPEAPEAIASGGAPPPPPPAPSSLDVTRGMQSLGLRLESRRAKIDSVVVDSAERVPSEN